LIWHYKADCHIKTACFLGLALLFSTKLQNFARFRTNLGIDHSISPHKLRHFLFSWMKKKGVDDALIQPYSGHESRQSLEIYSKLSLGDCQPEYEKKIKDFPI